MNPEDLIGATVRIRSISGKMEDGAVFGKVVQVWPMDANFKTMLAVALPGLAGTCIFNMEGVEFMGLDWSEPLKLE